MADCPNAYSQMSATVYGNQAYILGGIDKQTIGTNCQIYNLDNNWSDPAQYSLPEGRFGSVSFVYRDSLYVLGDRMESTIWIRYCATICPHRMGLGK